VHDSPLAALLEERLQSVGGVPDRLADGRCYRGVRPTFLVTKYEPGQFFAPHFDGCIYILFILFICIINNNNITNLPV
jgi:hypothetical protein